MATILVRDLPDPLHQELAKLAAERRMSVNSFTINLIEAGIGRINREAKTRENRGQRYPDA